IVGWAPPTARPDGGRCPPCKTRYGPRHAAPRLAAAVGRRPPRRPPRLHLPLAQAPQLPAVLPRPVRVVHRHLDAERRPHVARLRPDRRPDLAAAVARRPGWADAGAGHLGRGAGRPLPEAAAG